MTPDDIEHGPYKIQQIKPIPLPVEQRSFTYLISNIGTWLLWFSNLLFQIHCARVAQNHSVKLLWRTWAVLLAELWLSLQDLVLGINLILALFSSSSSSTRLRYRLTGQVVPTIDVFVTCYRESVDIILDTIAAAIAQDYPTQAFKILVLDDGHDAKLRTDVLALSEKSLATGGPRVYYFSREVKEGMKSFFKAGNLQFGIKKGEELGGSEFIASLDADMIPEKDWLRRIVPHLILQGNIALACPPQCYYNVPHNDPLGQKAEFDVWFSVFEPLNDRLDAAMCTGSGYIVRRSALKDIGGWPLVEAGEDFMCSAVLSNSGWKVVFIREDLQFGLAPDSLHSYIKQRTRWVDSGIEVHKQFGFYLPGSKVTSQLTFAQRGIGIIQALREYAPITNVLALLLLPVALYPHAGDEFTAITSQQSFKLIWAIFMASFVAKKINNYLLYSHVGLGRVIHFQSLDVWCAPYNALRCLISILPASTIPLTFESSGSIVSPLNERSAIHRKPLIQRLMRPDMVMHFIYITYASSPLLLRVYLNRPFASSIGSGSLVLLPGSTIKLLDVVAKASVPLRYMAFPPTLQEREELMEVDEHGVRRGKKLGKVVHSNFEWYTVSEIAGLLVLLGIWYNL
ncbi:glycosyltransferase like family 2-domain-containing protein [Calycina marina]|uniref:Glycosyltransferase like family 2-domain-containing protein n=1 Tax=Calycina marina TaxID=1763456 RepID=A0A9P7YX74_9HELO|nr:glycosyltransferase like family 2-domain-containing protein [Calycina marina]